MGNYRQFAEDLNELARGAFIGLLSAEETLNQAQANAKQYPMQGSGMVKEEYARQAIDAAHKLNKAKDAHSEAQAAMQAARRKMNELREKLANRVRDDFFPYGKDIDAEELKVLQSGILTPEELLYMYEVETKCGNTTMQRIIGKHAAELAKDLDALGNSTADHERAAKLFAVSVDSQKDRAAEVLQKFDNLLEIYDRSAANPAMISRWNEFAEPIIEAF